MGIRTFYGGFSPPTMVSNAQRMRDHDAPRYHPNPTEPHPSLKPLSSRLLRRGACSCLHQSHTHPRVFSRIYSLINTCSQHVAVVFTSSNKMCSESMLCNCSASFSWVDNVFDISITHHLWRTSSMPYACGRCMKRNPD